MPTSPAQLIYNGFREYRRGWMDITTSAMSLFQSQDWHAMSAATKNRLALYHRHLDNTVAAIATVAGDGPYDWTSWKAQFVSLKMRDVDSELAETFFNSVHRALMDDPPATDLHMFVRSRVSQWPIASHVPFMRTYQTNPDVVGDIVPMVHRLLDDAGLTLPWEDKDRDVRSILRSLAEHRPEIRAAAGLSIDVLNHPFFRNKGAYLVGRLRYETEVWPVALPILINARGELYVDTLICDADELSVVFSFTRAYFLVEAPAPSQLVSFLQQLMPNKRRAELYSAIGFHKHGKTEFYRAFVEHLDDSDDEFVIAPGIRGMVMTVFTLPSLPIVFKIIKDQFAPQKNITHKQVKEKYTIVKQHDRVGRMADTQEFSNFRFPRDRFSDALLEELLAVARSCVVLTDDDVVIRHLYTERRMTPLNIYVENASPEELTGALDEYGNAIKQLAAANIFPGDMLLKNFGVTRHGRVVFYDYDEINYLTEMNFREIPEAQTPEQEMASEPWYSVDKFDVFPEEFRRFLFGKSEVKAEFIEMHGDMFTANMWRKLQEGIKEGEVSDVFPYRRKRRFVRKH